MPDTLYTTAEVADRLNVSARRVRAIAQARNLGQSWGRARLFTQTDLDQLEHSRAAQSCECYLDCREDGHSGAWHQHDGNPCPVHPDQVTAG